MKLNHIALFSHDAEADRLMFERYFGLKTLVNRNSAVVILQDDDGFILMLNQFHKMLNGFAYPEKFDILHVGFIRDSREQVDETYERLLADGWQTQAPHDYHGAWAFYFRSKGGCWIEVTTATTVQSEDMLRLAEQSRNP